MFVAWKLLYDWYIYTFQYICISYYHMWFVDVCRFRITVSLICLFLYITVCTCHMLCVCVWTCSGPSGPRTDLDCQWTHVGSSLYSERIWSCWYQKIHTHIYIYIYVMYIYIYTHVYMYIFIYIYINMYIYLAGGLEHRFYVPVYWESSSQLTNIFERSWNHQPYIYILYL